MFNHRQKLNRTKKLKTLKDFISSQVVEEKETEVVIESNEPEVLELLEAEDCPLAYHELEEDKKLDPPAVLIMRRKWIRQYPNNQRVALYYVDKIDKYVTIPYTSMQWSTTSATSGVTEQVDESVDVIKQLQKIKDMQQHGTIKHMDGSSSKVDVNTAHAVLTVHKALNADNKKKFADMICKSNHHMKKAADFAWKHLK